MGRETRVMMVRQKLWVFFCEGFGTAVIIAAVG